MKQRFRRGKPSLRILEKGDLKRQAAQLRRNAERKLLPRPRVDVAKGIYPAKDPVEVIIVSVSNKNPIFNHGQPVTIKTGEHAGETAMVIGPSKTIPGRLGVLTMGGLVHYKPEDLEVGK